MKRRYLVAIIVAMIAVNGCTQFTKVEFNGSRSSNDTEFILVVDELNRSEEHIMSLTAGDEIAVSIEQISGKFDILVNGPDGKLYQGNNVIDSEFSIEVINTGEHTFYVSGDKGEGVISFVIKP